MTEELITTIWELKDLIRERKKELLKIPGITKDNVNSIKISVSINRDEKLKESYFK